MALYDDMVAEIITLTARPDLEPETELALRTATLNAHFSDFYPRDLSTQLVQLPNEVFLASIDAQVAFPRLRGLSRIRMVDINYAPIDDPKIEIVEIDDIYDPEYQSQLKQNIAYLGGTSVNVRSNTGFYGLLVEFYQAPQTKRDAYVSWIAQMYPDVIVYWAASIVLGTNGNEEKSNKYLKLIEAQFLPFLKANFLLGQAR